jgi:hypothetical protein
MIYRGTRRTEPTALTKEEDLWQLLYVCHHFTIASEKGFLAKERHVRLTMEGHLMDYLWRIVAWMLRFGWHHLTCC